MYLAQSVHVTGFSLFGPDPVGAVHLSFDGRHVTLYGLNGSGKTTLMDAMRKCLSGIATGSRAFAHLSFSEEYLGWSERLFSDLEGLVEHRLGHSTRPVDLGEVDDDAAWRGRVEAIRNDLASVGGPGCGLTPDSVGLTVEAIGTQTDPRWCVYLSTVVTPDQKGFESLNSLRDLADRHAEQSPSTARLAEAESALVRAGTVGVGWAEQDMHLHNQRSQTVRPDWVPVRLAQIGELPISDERISIVAVDDDVDAVERKSAEEIELVPSDAELWPSEEQRNHIDRFSNMATEYASTMFGIDARLVYRVSETEQDRHRRLRWFWSDSNGKEIPLRRTSSGERLIACTAISLAIRYAADSVTAVVFFDEPERSLHPHAIEQLSAGLPDISFIGDVYVPWVPLYSIVFATHAPALVNPDLFDVVHVDRHPSGEVRANRMQITTWAEPKRLAAELGWSPADVLQKIRKWIVVEGQHDMIVLDAVFGDELAKRGWALAPMHGAQRVNTAFTSRFLLDFTDATIRVVLDHIDAEAVEQFNRARDLYLDGNYTQSRQLLEQMGPPSASATSDEIGHLVRAAVEAVGRRTFERIEFVGLERPDILNYLDPADLGLTLSWDELLDQYRNAHPGKISGSAYKKWLKDHHRMKTDDDRLRAAALHLDDLGDLHIVVA